MAGHSERRLRATYRLQLNADFDFEAARKVVPYLASLGVSHLYLSPIWKAREGSTHGYDVVDHTAINPALGGRDGFDRLVATAHDHGLGLILDCVPNHMGIGYDNPWWVDVLTWGRTSPYANFFDIDWTPTEPTLRDTVLLPILGDHYGRVLENGEMIPAFVDGRLVVRYYEHTLPIFPRDTAEILDAAANSVVSSDGEDGQTAEILTNLARLAKSIHRRRERVSRQQRRADRDRAAALESQIAEAMASPTLRAALDTALALWTPTPAEGQTDEKTADRLHRLLERQAYRVAFWRLAAQEINYRRFFDINDLAGLRMEEPALFTAAHKLVLELTESGAADGLRLDHIDGLMDPAHYLQRLSRAAQRADGTKPAIHVEKILAPNEELRTDWPVDGTTGYDVMAQLHRLQIDPAGQKPLMALYTGLTGDTASFDAHIVRAKRLTMGSSLAAELNVLANSLNRLAKRSRLTRDYSLTGLREALANIVAHFSVYRTYIGRRGANDADRAVITAAVDRARRVATTPDLSIYDFLRAVLTTDAVADRTPGFTADRVLAIARKVQQYTSPVTAKSVEDTAFYRWVPLIGLNEVGNEPDHFSLSVEGFHAAQRERLARWPRSMVATATHDHKRGEDVRARLAVLSEMPALWRRHVRKWWQLNARKVTSLDDGPAPSPSDAYVFYQTLIAIWPPGLRPDDADGLAALADRLAGAMEKTGREAKLRTSWAVTNEAYETAVRRFVTGCLDPRRASVFLSSVADFVATIAPVAGINSLAQTALKLTVPGIPDTYQGTETWDFSLVDPDNRRPVDYNALEASLNADTKPSSLEPLCRTSPDGRIKQALVARLLAARRDDPDLFIDGGYEPVTVSDMPAGSAVAFARILEDRAIVIAVPRLVAARITDPGTLAVNWGDAAIDPNAILPGATTAHCLLTGAAIESTQPLALAGHAQHPPILVVRLTR